MKIVNTLLVCLLLVGVVACKQENKTSHNMSVRNIPVEDFFRNPDVSNFSLSPEGDQIAFTKPYKNRMNIHVCSLGGKDTIKITSEENRDIMSYFWKSNKRLIYAMDNGGDENFHLHAVDADGKNMKDLTPFPGVRAEVVDELEDNEQEMLISMNKRDPENFDVYRLNIENGTMNMVAQNPGGVSAWVTDHDGKIRVALRNDGVNQELLYRATEKEPFKMVLKTSFKETVQPMFFTFDNKQVYALSNLGRDKSAVVKFDVENGKEMELLFEHPEVDVEGMSYSRKRKVLTAIEYEADKTERKFLDPEMEAIYKKLEAKLGNSYEIIITSANRNEDKFLVRTISDRSLGASYFYDVAKDELTKIADRAPWIKEEEMAVMKAVKYTSKDGITIHGYLTLPAGVEPKNLPVVINPHGGPWARDSWGFNPEVQFLANRGYAVLQMNFRGSVGYGRKFWEASFKQWGLSMQQDITDGVDWLVKEGIADPKRVAIYGASYGGYATLAGAAFTPDLYACAVDYVGVSNMFTFMKTIPPYWKPFLQMMYEMVGDPVKDSALLYEVSPVFHVDKIKAPLFVAQGANDPRVNKDESDQMVEALKKRGIAVEYMVKDNEGHGFHNEENRFDFYNAIEKFLAKHLGTKKEDQPAS